MPGFFKNFGGWIRTTADPDPVPPRYTPEGSLPDPSTGSRSNQSATAPYNDNYIGWARNWAQAPYAPRPRFSPDPNTGNGMHD